MTLKEWFDFDFSNFPHKSSNSQTGKNNLITVYIVLFVLKKMKKQLGLEATLEYIEQYMKTIEKQNPKLEGHVSGDLSNVDIEKMYKETML